MFKQDNLDWDGVKELRDRWPGKFVLKGVLHPEDAEWPWRWGRMGRGFQPRRQGARSLGRSHRCPARYCQAVGGRMSVLLDSGVRRGSDIVKALALGADRALVGRAPLYGMAAAGEPGVARAIELLGSEISRTMAMLGLTSVDQIDSNALA